MIKLPALSRAPVLYGSYRTGIYACHTVVTFMLPDGAPVFYAYIIDGTHSGAFSASYACIFCIEQLVGLFVFYPYGIKGQGDELFKQEDITVF